MANDEEELMVVQMLLPETYPNGCPIERQKFVEICQEVGARFDGGIIRLIAREEFLEEYSKLDTRDLWTVVTKAQTRRGFWCERSTPEGNVIIWDMLVVIEVDVLDNEASFRWFEEKAAAWCERLEQQAIYIRYFKPVRRRLLERLAKSEASLRWFKEIGIVPYERLEQQAIYISFFKPERRRLLGRLAKKASNLFGWML